MNLEIIQSVQFIHIHVCTYKYLYYYCCGLAPRGSWDPPCSPQLFLLSRMIWDFPWVCQYQFWQCPLPAPPTPPDCPGEMGWEAEKILKLYKHCLVITCCVIKKLSFVHKSKYSTTGAAMKQINSIQTKANYMCYAYVCNSDRNPQRGILAFQNNCHSETHFVNIPVFSLCM